MAARNRRPKRQPKQHEEPKELKDAELEGVSGGSTALPPTADLAQVVRDGGASVKTAAEMAAGVNQQVSSSRTFIDKR